jgi:N6-L-threonylcarbamoyladenine synthase
MSRVDALQKTNIKEQLSAIAFTQGPGLMGSLLVGSSLPNQWL